MRISVISPTHRSGTSTVAAMLGQSLAHTQGLKVMLTYTGQKRDMCNYMGIQSIMDKTRTLSQVVKLLESRSISPEDMYDYSIKAGPNMNIFDTADNTISEEEAASLTPFVFKNIKSDISICDVNTEIFDSTTQTLFDTSDIVCIVINPDNTNYNILQNWKDSDLWPKKAEVMIVVNRYDEQIDALRNISKRLCIAHSNVCKLHYNPLLTKYSNTGKLMTVFPFIINKDAQVIEMNTDFKECTQYIISLYGNKFKWGV